MPFVLNIFPFLIIPLMGALYYIAPQSMGIIFLINLWLLSYPHTLATFTKKPFTKRKYKLLGILVLLIMGFSIASLAYYKDKVYILNIYFLLQFIHYIRQNYGISRRFQKAFLEAKHLQINGLLFLVAILSRDHLTLFNFQLDTFPNQIPWIWFYILHLSFVIYSKVFTWSWKFENSQYLLLTLSIFNIIPLEVAWICLNISHNLQYLFAVKISDHASSKMFYFYIFITLAASAIFKGLEYLDGHFQWYLSISFIVALALNFTHYFFDSILWRKSLT